MTTSQFIKTYHNPNSLYVNQDKKWLWLRIHKTAGTSMYDAFLKDHCLNIAKKGQSEQVRTWQRNITDAELEQYTIWTCVRNPYDRFNSMANMFKKEPNDFARNFQEYRKNGVIARHTLPQHLFTHNGEEQVINYIIYFESLQPGFSVLCQYLDLPAFKLPRLNASRSHAPWQEAFEPETINFVNKHFELDFKYFNYKML